jgi:hypothetical protein
MKEINAGQYLRRIESEKGKLPESEIAATIARLKIPFREVVYGEQGAERIETDHFAFEFSYSHLERTEQKEEVERRLARNGINDQFDFGSPANWRKLNGLVFESKNGQRIDLFEKLPADSEILFCPTNKEFHGSVDSSTAKIHILGNLATSISLITLLHEVGHVFDRRNLEKLGMESMMEGRDSTLGEKLRKERSASAFAFKVIKSIIPEGQLRTDARIFLKNYALESYHASIKEDIADKAAMSRFYRSEYDLWALESEEETRQKFSEFEKWRKTEAYEKWKVLPENRDVSFEKGEEFGHWSEWVKKNGYDFYKDIYPDAGESI